MGMWHRWLATAVWGRYGATHGLCKRGSYFDVMCDQVSIASLCLAYAINIGVLRKGCVLRHARGAENRRGGCGAGVVYQKHRATIMARLRGAIRYQVTSVANSRCEGWRQVKVMLMW